MICTYSENLRHNPSVIFDFCNLHESCITVTTNATSSLYQWFVALGITLGIARQLLTNFYASTEEGELILGDWAARGEEDRCGFRNSDGIRVL